MEKKSIKKYISGGVAVLLIAALVIVPFALEDAKETSEDKTSILSAEVTSADISKTVSGAGTLTDEDAVEIKLPYGVEVTKYLVSNGDFVTEGQALAEVDRIDVMNSIYEYQEDIEYVETQMALYTDTGAVNFLTTSSAGRVMEIYANVGDSISDVMLEHGALAVLSLDGLLAVDIEIDTLPVGSSVGVAASDGTILSGHVESKKDGVCVITVDQEGRAVGEHVSVFNENSETIGEGELYVHSPLKISGYSGTIEAVHVKIGQDMQSGGTVFTYSGNSNSAEYDVYAAKHTELTGYVEELFKMYTDGTINAENAGVVSGIDEDAAAELLSASGEEKASLDLLTNVTTLENGASGNTSASTVDVTYPYVYYEAGKVNYMVTNYDASENPGNSWINILRTDSKYTNRLEAINSVASASWVDNLSFEQLNNYGVATSQITESNVGDIIFVFEYYCQSPDTYTLNSVTTEISGVTVWASTTAEKNGDEPALDALVNQDGKTLMLLSDVTPESDSDTPNDTPSDTQNGGEPVPANDGTQETPDEEQNIEQNNNNQIDNQSNGLSNILGEGNDEKKDEDGDKGEKQNLPTKYYSAGIITKVNSNEKTGEVISVYYKMLTGDRYTDKYAALAAVQSENATLVDVTTPMDVPFWGLNESNAVKGAFLLFVYSTQESAEASYVDVVDVSGTIKQSAGGGQSSGMTSSTTQASYEYYPTKKTTIMSVTPQDTMTVDITVDELDILSIKKGQSVQITLDALAGQSFDGEITDIGVSGSNSGGNTKYTAEVTIDRAANMIAGMNATALITLETDENLVTVPCEALVNDGTRTYVYTSYDSKTNTLGSPVDVETGASDGVRTEIKSGLAIGDTVWYAYYDKLDNDTASGGGGNGIASFHDMMRG
jgi:multidrug efflux pump subunit AcrA (membrane-fusion protein)